MDVREDNEDLIGLEVNGKLIRENIRMSNGFNRIGHVTPDDEVKIIISDNTGIAFQSNEELSEVKYFIYKLDNDALGSFVDNLSEHQMEISDFKDDSFNAKILLDKNQVLFTSIPYDKGWHVYENGKELKTEMLAWTFLGLDLGEGEHELSFKFVPEGLYSGIIVTVISWIVFIILLYVYRKKYNSEDR